MKRLRVLYDFEAFSDQSRGGITRYALELAERIARDADVLLSAGVHRSLALRDRFPTFACGWYFRPLKWTGEMRRRLNAALTRSAIARFRPDIVHRTYFRGAARYPGAHREVLTIYDLTYFLFPELFPRNAVVRRNLNRIASRADLAICISQHTQTDAIRLLDLPVEKTAVVPLGVNVSRGVPGPSPLGTPYLLFVGERAGYKNFEIVLKAIAGDSRLSRFSLLAFGGADFSTKESAIFTRLGLHDRVRRTSGGDAELSAAYEHAAALVYPSLYEGFGLPLLEAMAHRCPVVCSNTSSLPEVGGDAAEYFASGDSTDLAAALCRVTLDETRLEQLRSSGQTRAAKFSWERCAADTLRLYEQIVSATMR